jgi:hypothetical protein
MLNWLFPKAAHRPRNGAADGYPWDYDASLRFVRPKTGIDEYPTHSNADNFAKYGCMPATYPLYDNWVWGQMWGKSPGGPISSPLPHNLQWQITIPGLDKQKA